EREAIVRTANRELREFLTGSSVLTLQAQTTPVVSVVLVLYNRAELTLRCLRSITACSVPLQVVLVDNASSDSTSTLLDRVQNAIIVRQETNAGFSAGVNAASQVARGEFLLLLNNDTELNPGCLEAAVACAESAPDIGVVGGKLILPG